jgi:hypothetical protein
VSIRTAIHNAILANPSASADDIAADVLKQVRKVDVLPLVIDEVMLQQRYATRRMERSVTIRRLGPLLERSGSFAAASTEVDNRERLLVLMRQVWRLGDGSTVAIGQATLPEIEQRLDMLRKQHAGLSQTIKILETVQAELKRSGARCLDDLIDGEVAA